MVGTLAAYVFDNYKSGLVTMDFIGLYKMISLP
jgi:hypothetical protein